MDGEQGPIRWGTRPIHFVLGFVKEHVPRHFRRAILARGLTVSRAVFRGDAVECPACGETASRYVRDRCPACSAASRQRLIGVFMRRELGLDDRHLRLLHFAPEPGLTRMFSRLPNVDYAPADLVPDRGHERVDATDIQLAPNFDGIITSHVLEHITDDATAISEMYRVLRPGGWALVIVPFYTELAETHESSPRRTSWERHVHYGQHDHVRMYGRDFASRLSAPGFVVEERRYADEIPASDVSRFGLSRGDVIHLCRKPLTDS